MSVFKNIGKSISNKSREISQKAKIMSETSSLNNIIKGEECKIDSQYKLIGKMYFEKYGENPSEEFQPAIDAIKNSIGKIGETKEEIAKIKSRFCCPSCGTPFKNDAVFCSKCGTRLPEKPKAKQSVKRVCANCGNTLEENALFCNICGTKFENTDSNPEPVNEALQPVPSAVENAPEITAEEDKKDVKEIAAEEAASEPAPQPEETASDDKETPSEEKTSDTEEKKFCPDCNNEVHNEDMFCDSCGAKLK